MGESRRVLATNVPDASCKRPRYTQPRISKLKFAACVDSIKENFKKISAYTGNSRNRALNRDILVEKDAQSKRSSALCGDNGVTEKSTSKCQDRRSSFEIFLSTIPKLDPIDRTVGWVFTQPNEIDREDLTHLTKLTGSNRSCTELEELDYETSVSRCESARGTHGRGTPPAREVGQPQLDDLFRKLQMKQEREARRRKMQAEDKQRNSMLLRGNLLSLDHALPPHSQLKHQPKQLRADILHKNSSYYNKASDVVVRHKTAIEHCCEWRECRARFLSSKDLLRHIQEEHLSCLPQHAFQSQRQLVCQWRNCKENRCYPARYSLLLHLQRVHCRNKHEDHKVPCGEVQRKPEVVQTLKSDISSDSGSLAMEIAEQLSESV